MVSHPVLLDGGTVVSQSNLGGSRAEVGQAKDGQVLMVQALILHNEPLHLFHYRQHPRLALISTVSWNGHKHTARILISQLEPNQDKI